VYESIWQAVRGELSGERARDLAARLWEHARWNAFDRMQGTADEIAAVLGELGLQDVEVRRYPADGVTAHGGWVMPLAWDVEDAHLEIIEPAVADPCLAHYRDCPQSLMMYSAPTPPEGVTAEVVAVDRAGDPAAYDGRDVRGRFVLADAIGLDFAACALERGAAGLVSDAMKLAGSPQEKSPGWFDRAVQWHNFTLPPWRTDGGAFGFSISPADGRRLRDLVRAHGRVRLRAVVRARLYDGTFPLVTGLLPGASPEQVLLTGHLCEPGANDNASGCALGLEAVRTVAALVRQGRLPPLRRGLRPIFTFEVRGLQAYLAEGPPVRRFLAGINLDMVGADLSDARAVCNLLYNWPALPACTDFLALDLLRRLAREDPLFRFRARPADLVDNVLGEPGVGAPTCVLGCWPDATYHTSLDRPEALSPAALASLGRVAATYCAFLAGAGLPEALWLARLAASCGEEELLEAARQTDPSEPPDLVADRLRHVAARNVRRLRSVVRLVPGRSLLPTRETLAAQGDYLCPRSHLAPEEELRARLDRLAAGFLRAARRIQRDACAAARGARRFGGGRGAAAAGPPAHSADEERRAAHLVPVRLFRGALAFESLDAQARRDLRQRAGLTVGWGAPGWLQSAVFLASGKRTALEIWRRMRWDSPGISPGALCDALVFLADHDFLHLRPVLARDDYLAALRRVGLPAGAVVMAHVSLSRFGYVEGGEDTVLDALLEALGPEGTLVMPTLSCSWVGRPPFDPRRTPSRVGAVTEAFRRRPGVLRSPHPTHSVAALGPRAAEITRVHSPERPVFAPEGAFGKLYDLDAWILLLAPLAANTCMHMGEERAGVPLVDIVARAAGRGRAEARVVRVPWHVNFRPHYDVLFERGLVRSTPLGEDTIHLVRVRDAVDAAEANLRRDPLLAAAEGCQCAMCRRVRAAAR